MKLMRIEIPLRLVVSIAGCTLLTVGLFGCEADSPAAQPAMLVQLPFEPDSGNLFIRCGALIDGLGDDVLHDRMVVIQDGRITDILAGDADRQAGVAFLDLSAKTCLPGLSNTHTHIGVRPEDSADMSVYYRRSIAETTDIAVQHAAQNLLTGFTTIWNVGDYFPQPVYDVRQRIRSGELPGPRILTAGPYLTVPAGGGDLVIPGHDEADIPPAVRTGVARGADEFAVKTRQAIDNGADMLKVIASGAVFAFGGVPGAPEMTQEEIAAVVATAHAAGLKVTAHVHSAQSGMDAARAGVDTFEHASLLDDETIAMVAAAGIALSMDVYNGTYTEDVGREQNYPEEFMRKNRETTEAQRIVFEKAYAAGIPILFGTDAGVLPHDMGAWQFNIMVERGMKPMDAIKSATSVPANHMGTNADVGAIEVGRFGDLIAVSGNPLSNMLLMREVDVVVKGGLVFKNQERE